MGKGYATDEMLWLAGEWKAAVPSAVFSGIVGDANHLYGYHLSYIILPGGDYSKQLAGDRNNVDVEASDALDMSMPRADMIRVTNLVYASWKRQDDLRLNYWREIIGTRDGVNVIYMDTQSGGQGTSDSSHLWHMHCGGLRSNVHNMWAMRALLSIVKGESWETYKANNPSDPMVLASLNKPVPAPPPPPPPRPKAPAWPLRYDHWFGDINGPDKSHGGYYSSERWAIIEIQKALIRKGYARTYGGAVVRDVNSGWADGKFDRLTIEAVARWQRAEVPGTQYFGQVWSDDWAKLLG